MALGEPESPRKGWGRMNTYEAKIEEKKERYLELAEKNKAESDRRFETSRKMADAIPFGQPILVGHHSEGRDRNYRARITGQFEKAIECDEKAKYYEGKAASVGTAGISSDDPNGVVKLKEKLEKLEAMQELYKGINKAIKNGSDIELKRLGLNDAQIVEIKKTDFCGRVGIPSYKLTNNNAVMRSTKKRIEELENKSGDVTSSWKIGDVEVIDNVEENRLQVVFPAIPSEEIRGKLKVSGFRWCPTSGCWQRMRSNAARYALEYALVIKA